MRLKKKSIIYDTEKAGCIGSYEEWVCDDETWYVVENLCFTPDAKDFLYRQFFGYPKAGEQKGKPFHEEIVPLSDKGSALWAKEKYSELYDAVFKTE